MAGFKMWKRVLLVFASVASALLLRRQVNPIIKKISESNAKTVRRLGGWRWPKMTSNKNKS